MTQRAVVPSQCTGQPTGQRTEQGEVQRFKAGVGGAQAMAAGSSSFTAAVRLLDASTRESTVMLYAWCRHCDDTIDGQHLGHRTHACADVDAAGSCDDIEKLGLLEHATKMACEGRPSMDPVFIGLAEVVQRHQLPTELLQEHLAGFRMDVEQIRYQSLEDTLVYCHRVAGVVGLMMGRVMGARGEAVLAGARDLGIAFQLSNIARDVIDDAAVGRVYLPAAWLEEAGVAPESLHVPESREALATVAARLVDAAEPYYASALRGIGALPLRNAWSVATARDIYRAIGRKVKQRGARAWDVRTRTSSFEKGRLTARGAGVALATRALSFWPKKDSAGSTGGGSRTPDTGRPQ